uniref:hypothetical protein n=1 Tax=Niallia taxi TaxID=2499688 RepID=UPI003F496542
MFRKISTIILSILLIVSLLINLKYLSENYATAATISDIEINKKQINQVLKDKYWDKSLDDVIDNNLIKLESKNYKKPTKEDLSKMEEFTNVVRISTPGTQEEKQKYLEQLFYIHEIAKKNTVTDEELKNYIKEAKKDTGEYYYELLKFTTNSHEVAKNIENDLKAGKSIDTIEQLYNVKASIEKKYDTEAYEVKLSDLSVGQVVLSMDMSENSEMDHSQMDHSQMDHSEMGTESNNDSHLVIQMLEKSEIDDLDIRSEDIVDGYLMKEYFTELIEIKNLLRSKYDIDIR